MTDIHDTGDVLDQWLATATSSLHAALDRVLDLEAGLADATLPAAHTALVQKLGDVLDLEAGLDHVLNPPLPDEVTAAQALTAGLKRFADTLAAQSPADRLSARTWFPERELIVIRHIARLAPLARALARELALSDTGDHAESIVRSQALADALAHVRLSAFEPDANRSLERAVAMALERTRDLSLDIAADPAAARDLASGLVRKPSRDPSLDPTPDRSLTLAQAFAIDLALELIQNVADGPSAADLGRALASGLMRGLAPARDHAWICTRARAVDSALAQTHVRDRDLDVVDDAIAKVIDHMLTTVTDLVGADLADADLRGVPLEGVRWSHSTHWPTNLINWVRKNSLQLGPDLFEVRENPVDTGTVTAVHTRQ